jgi:serine/threonine protein kinase
MLCFFSFSSGAHGSISALGSRSIPSVLLSCISSSVHSLGHLLPTSIKLRMAKECCAGVMYLHSKSIMHCDIKSLNFLGARHFYLLHTLHITKSMRKLVIC